MFYIFYLNQLIMQFQIYFLKILFIFNINCLNSNEYFNNTTKNEIYNLLNGYVRIRTTIMSPPYLFDRSTDLSTLELCICSVSHRFPSDYYEFLSKGLRPIIFTILKKKRFLF